MIDQLIIGDKASFDDFGASVAKRVDVPPKKKSIKETVPFSNVTYDFSAIDGEIYWEERELEYAFEMISSTPEGLEDMKTAFRGWLMNIIQQELHDPFVPDHYYIATYDDMSFEDEEGMDKTTAVVKFTAYPYKISNHAKRYEYEIPVHNTVSTFSVLNESNHRITPTITSDRAITIMLAGDNYTGVSYTMEAGTVKDDAFKLAVGMNRVHVTNSAGDGCNVVISFNEEVF